MRLAIVFLSLFLALSEAGPAVGPRGVALSMIVKNEAHVIERALKSALPFVSCWVVVDTGSTDDTEEIVERTMGDLPGQIMHRPWRNFGDNRQEALDAVAAVCPSVEFVAFLDADDVFETPANVGRLWEALARSEANAFHVEVRYADIVYSRLALVRNNGQCRWMGVLHEYLDCPGPFADMPPEALRLKIIGGGARSKDPDKFKRDAELLREALEREPDNTRYMFYLAQSYRDAGMLAEAVQAYQRRASMLGGYAQERYLSMVEVGKIADDPGVLFQALRIDPHRAEAVYWLTKQQRIAGNHHLCYMWGKMGQVNLRSPPRDALFLERWVYDYALEFELSICAYYEGYLQESLDLATELLRKHTQGLIRIPPEYHSQIVINADFPRRALLRRTRE